MRQSIINIQKPPNETWRTAYLLLFSLIPSSGQVQRTRINLHIRCTLQVEKFDRSLNKSLQNVDIMEYQTLQFDDDFAEGSKCQLS